jgi:hypothetical protein
MLTAGYAWISTWVVPVSTVQHVIATAPAGLSLTVDSTPRTAPYTVYWTPGTQHTIATSSPQAGGTGIRYVFASWSDGGGLSHSITASSSPATYTANFTTQYYLTTAASPSAGGTISPASSWRNSGSVVSVSATANSGYVFSGFSGALTGTTTPQNLTMNAPKSVTANFTGSTVQHVITTAPAGLSLTVDSAPCTAPCTFQWTPGTNHTIATTTPQPGGTGTQYVFASWSDGGAISHSITASSSPATYTANFTTQYYLTTAASPPAGGTISPASGWYNNGTVVSVSATANSGYQFTGFSGALTGTTTPQNLTMNAPKSVTAGFVPSGPLTVSCSAMPTPALVGQTVTFSATVSGGSPPYTYWWSGAVSGSGQSVSFVPAEAGGYQASVTVNQMGTASCSTAVADPILAAFRDCIGPNGTGATCQLAPGTYEVPPPFYDSYGQLRHYLEVGRSGITITGTMSGGPADTVVRRGSWLATAGPTPAPATYIMKSSGPFTGVTISYLTFDGNRYGAGLNCLPGNAEYYDLDLGAGGAFTVQWVDFINAPGTALVLGGNSTVSLSNFGQGGYGIGPSLVPGYESPAQTATRSTAIWVGGSDNGAWYNAISYAGTAAITLDGPGQYAYGNLLYSNRYEISDGVQGGQIFVSPSSTWAAVAGNVIDGGDWPPPEPQLATGCAAPASPQFNAGVEGYGFDHRFYNNEIVNNTGSGMQFAGSEPTGRITVSSANPWDPSDTPRFIERNHVGGIAFLGPQWCTESNFQGPCQAAGGVTLDAILVRDNGGPSVFLDGVSNNGSYTGFVNGSCISGNHIDGVPADIPTGQNSLTYPVPSSYDSIRGGTCPVSAWPQLPAPASSHIPGWPW